MASPRETGSEQQVQESPEPPPPQGPGSRAPGPPHSYTENPLAHFPTSNVAHSHLGRAPALHVTLSNPCRSKAVWPLFRPLKMKSFEGNVQKKGESRLSSPAPNFFTQKTEVAPKSPEMQASRHFFRDAGGPLRLHCWVDEGTVFHSPGVGGSC